MTPHPIDASEGSEESFVSRVDNHLIRVCFLIVLTLPVCAQPSTLSDEIVVTASGVTDSVESTPSAVTVISREEIERRQARDVAEVLREVPGVTVARSGSPGKVSSLFIRGTNSQHTLVLWNGMKINNPFFSGYDWGRFSTSGVDRVEVVPGPYSALYGSDAVGGVVNVLTTSSGRSLNADLEAGQQDLLNGSLSGAFTRGELSVNGAAEYRTDDGFQPNDDFRQDMGMAGVRWAPSGGFSVGLQTRYSRYDLGIPQNVSADGSEFVPSPNRRQDGSELQLFVPISFRASGSDFSARLSRSARDDSYSDPADPFGQTWASTASETLRGNASASRETAVGTWTFGGEYETATVDDRSSYGVNLEDEERRSASLFLEDRLSISLRSGAAFEISAGARYDDFDSFGSELSPRVAAAYVRGVHKVRAAYGQAFRAPSIGELYYPFFGNEALDPEHGRSAEIGYDAFLRSATLSVTLFRGEYDDLIVYDTVASTFGNVSSARTQGVELSAGGQLNREWSLAGTYTYLHTRQDETGEALLRRPRHSGTLSLGFSRGAAGALLTAVYNGSRNDVTDLAPFGTVINDDYTIADLTVHYTFGRLRPYLKIENLTDAEYQEIYGYPSPQRRALVGVRYAFAR